MIVTSGKEEIGVCESEGTLVRTNGNVLLLDLGFDFTDVFTLWFSFYMYIYDLLTFHQVHNDFKSLFKTVTDILLYFLNYNKNQKSNKYCSDLETTSKTEYFIKLFSSNMKNLWLKGDA